VSCVRVVSLCRVARGAVAGRGTVGTHSGGRGRVPRPARPSSDGWGGGAARPRETSNLQETLRAPRRDYRRIIGIPIYTYPYMSDRMVLVPAGCWVTVSGSDSTTYGTRLCGVRRRGGADGAGCSVFNRISRQPVIGIHPGRAHTPTHATVDADTSGPHTPLQTHTTNTQRKATQ
jgi:hypothetical protein